MVKPGGTGRPSFVIWARPAPLPPRTSFIFPLPSALPPPKEYTYLFAVDFFSLGRDSDFASDFCSMISLSGRVVVAMCPLRFSLFLGYFGIFAFGHDLRKVRDRGEFLDHALQKGEPIGTQIVVVYHDHHF